MLTDRLIRWARSRIGLGLLSLCLLGGLSGCWNAPDAQTSALYGAGIGAAWGGVFGCTMAYSFSSRHNQGEAFAIGCPVGVAAGALVGGVLGYVAYGPPPKQWTPPPKPTPPPPPPPPAPPPPAPEKIILRGVHFDFNKAKIRPGDAAVLDESATLLKSHPNMVVNVNGYCDAVGGDEYNLKLSQRRADAVVGYLENQGISSSRLIAHGYGKTDFVATNDTPEGRAQNRRVELVPVQ
jgi:outer membrane protein OmpA-like peptidoglycan-associated protein